MTVVTESRCQPHELACPGKVVLRREADSGKTGPKSEGTLGCTGLAWPGSPGLKGGVDVRAKPAEVF